MKTAATLVIGLLWMFALMICPQRVRAAGPPVDFSRDVRPILNEHCTKCHGGVKAAGKVSFVYRDKAIGKAFGDPVVPGDPEASELVYRITTDDDDEVMPPREDGVEALSAEQKKILIDWVKQGATWDEHWAFVPPTAPEAPAVKHPDRVRRPLDRFVLARLEAEGMNFQPDADRAQWLRRVHFDLVGLPPSLEELNAFESDDSPEAFERAVDRLLKSPRFGERWATLWLDLARYADSMGYERDPPRTIWPYRDWVIRALNEDMPFDRFTTLQLAGDLVGQDADRPLDHFVATAFHRNSQTNTEGGSDDEEFRIAALVDRVNTTWMVWQGFNFGCVQCHNHPYMPLQHEEYYRFAAFFNNVADCDLRDEYPTVRVPKDPKLNEKAMELERAIAELSRQIMLPFQMHTGETPWQPVSLEKIESNKPQARLVIRSFEGRDEVVAEGTVAQRSVYTVHAEPPLKTITAIRVDVPQLEGDDARNPSPAFVVNKTEVKLVRAGKATPVAVAFTAADEAGGMFWAPERWGAFPNQFHDRWTVLVLKEALTMQPGDRLTVTFHQNKGRDGAAPPVLRRFRLSVTDRPAWIRQVQSSEHAERLKQRAERVKQWKAIPGANMPVLRERLGFARQTAVFKRGNWLDKGELVQPAVPAVLPAILDREPDRLDMARWLTSDANPLTARVQVNRIWAALFGLGLVETEEDFGPTGTSPSHPELLDHLAVRFRDVHHWKLKPLLRELVLSTTYRQDSRTTAERIGRDPRNRLLSRGPRERLSAEMVRDHALKVAGLLSDKMYGPPVMPPQPDGVWQTVYSNLKWKTAQGEDRHRRGLYTYWRRSSPYPSFMTFDAPARQVCNARRISTNTPLQALVTLNDPVYVEASRAFARRMLTEGGAETAARIQWGLHLATSRKPRAADVEALVRLYAGAMEHYASDLNAAKKLGESPEAAAMTLVANTILNLDASLTR